jgi:putative transposase
MITLLQKVFLLRLKKRVTRKKIYSTRDEAKTEIFNFIEMFYNPKKRYPHTGGVSPAKLEEVYPSCLVKTGKSSARSNS